ncbi:MAG: hypothetical protein ACREE6_13615 [Limisphaerales bacterium]
MKNYTLNGVPAGHRNGGANGVVTWRIVATAAVLGLATVLWWQLQSISARVDTLTLEMGRVTGWIDAQRAQEGQMAEDP